MPSAKPPVRREPHCHGYSSNIRSRDKLEKREGKEREKEEKKRQENVPYQIRQQRGHREKHSLLYFWRARPMPIRGLTISVENIANTMPLYHSHFWLDVRTKYVPCQGMCIRLRRNTQPPSVSFAFRTGLRLACASMLVTLAIVALFFSCAFQSL